MSDSKRIIPIRPGVGLASSREKPDDDIDDFDESTVVDKGQFAHSLFDGLDDDLDEANLPGPPAHINPVQNMSPRAAVSLPGVSINQSPQTRPQQPAQVSSAPHAPQPSYQTPAPQMPQAGHAEQLGHQPAYQTPVPGQMHTPMPPMYQTPVPGQMYTPVPAMYQTPVPPMYQTPVPGQMHTPMPAMYHTPGPGPAAAPASKSNTTVLIIVGAVVLMLAGVGVGSILFMGKDAQPSQTQASASAAQPGEQNAQVAEPTPPVAAVKTPVAETPVTNPAAAETPVTNPVVAETPVTNPVVAEPVTPTVIVAEVPEPEKPVENDTNKPSAKPALAIKAPISGEVTQVFLKKAGSVRKGAKLFVISELGGVSDAKKKELSDAVSEAEKMVKEDPDLYGPFLVKAKRALASATKTKSVTVNAQRAGSAVPSVKAGDKVKRGQTLAKIN